MTCGKCKGSLENKVKDVRQKLYENRTNSMIAYVLSGITAAFGLAAAVGGLLTDFSKSKTFLYSGGAVFVLGVLGSMYFLDKSIKEHQEYMGSYFNLKPENPNKR